MFEMIELKKLLRLYRITPTKRLGQNFLVNQDIAEQVVMSLSNINNSNIIEVGPGAGILTNILLKKDLKSLTVIEMDKRFLPILEKIRSQTSKNFYIINANALKIVEEDIINEHYKIISNLPYNIGTLLLVKWLKKMSLINEIVVMLQKEVADRVLARVGTSNYGRLSVLAPYVCNCERLFDVAPENFSPMPKVNSSVIKLIPKIPRIKFNDIEKMERVCKMAFNFRRKKIKKSLEQIFSNPENELERVGIDYNKRPEELSVYEFYKISCIMQIG